MAQITAYRDDKDGTHLSADEVVSIRFAVDGDRYIIDLTSDNAEEFYNQWQPWIEVARKDVSVPKRGTRSRNATNSRSKNAKIRQWANENGFEVSDRGPLRQDIVSAYDAAHARTEKVNTTAAAV